MIYLLQLYTNLILKYLFYINIYLFYKYITKLCNLVTTAITNVNTWNMTATGYVIMYLKKMLLLEKN